ncbi:hypothetical protein AB0K35_01385 [Micromonospora sp. NPDC053740]|uniref:hypothetical protein n=1 Tax=Micromonospora sp. NPDC053740 TaxID=3155173 RepID=UPI00342A2180
MAVADHVTDATGAALPAGVGRRDQRAGRLRPAEYPAAPALLVRARRRMLKVLGSAPLGGVEQLAGGDQLVVVGGGEGEVDGITDALAVVATGGAGVGTKEEDAVAQGRGELGQGAEELIGAHDAS